MKYLLLQIIESIAELPEIKPSPEECDWVMEVFMRLSSEKKNRTSTEFVNMVRQMNAERSAQDQIQFRNIYTVENYIKHFYVIECLLLMFLKNLVQIFQNINQENDYEPSLDDLLPIIIEILPTTGLSQLKKNLENIGQFYSQDDIGFAITTLHSAVTAKLYNKSYFSLSWKFSAKPSALFQKVMQEIQIIEQSMHASQERKKQDHLREIRRLDLIESLKKECHEYKNFIHRLLEDYLKSIKELNSFFKKSANFNDLLDKIRIEINQANEPFSHVLIDKNGGGELKENPLLFKSFVKNPNFLIQEVIDRERFEALYNLFLITEDLEKTLNQVNETSSKRLFIAAEKFLAQKENLENAYKKYVTPGYSYPLVGRFSASKEPIFFSIWSKETERISALGHQIYKDITLTHS